MEKDLRIDHMKNLTNPKNIEMIISSPKYVNSKNPLSNLSNKITNNSPAILFNSNTKNDINILNLNHENNIDINKSIKIRNNLKNNPVKILNPSFLITENLNINDQKKINVNANLQNLKINLSNSDKQDLLYLLNNNNINLSANNRINTNSSFSNNDSTIIIPEKEINNQENKSSKVNSTKNSNLFLTKIDEDHNLMLTSKYSRFNINTNHSQENNNLKNNFEIHTPYNINKENNDNQKENLKKFHHKNKENINNLSDNNHIDDMSAIVNKNITNDKKHQNIITSMTTPKNLIYNITEIKEINEYDRQDSSFNLLDKLDLNNNNQNNIYNFSSKRRRNRENSNFKFDSKNYVSGMNSLDNSSNLKKSTTIGSIQKTDDDYHFDPSFDRNSEDYNKKKINKSSYDILDFLSKDFNSAQKIENNRYDLNNSLKKKKKVSENNLFKKTNIHNLDKFNEKQRIKDSLILNTEISQKINFERKQSGFLDEFLSVCKSQENSLGKIQKIMNRDLSRSPKTMEKLNIKPEGVVTEINRKVDKELFFMDSKDNGKKKDKILLLLATEGKDKKKQFYYENRNSPLFVGEIISKLDDNFAFKCKKLFYDKFMGVSVDKNSIKYQQEEELKFLENEIKMDLKHKEVQNMLYEMETCRNQSIKRIRNRSEPKQKNMDSGK